MFNALLSRHEFVLIDTDFGYTKFTGVIEEFMEQGADEVAAPTVKASVGNIEVLEIGNLLTRCASDELPQISI